MEEVRSPLVLIAWSDVKIKPLTLDFLTELEQSSHACTVPLMQTDHGDIVPSLHLPVFTRSRFRAVPWKSVQDGASSLYPFDYLGVYRKETFLSFGGFDEAMHNPYWQKLDFGYRCYLWGDDIVCRTSFQVSYLGEMVPEDSTPDAGYKLFFLKNLAVRIKKGQGLLSFLQFPRYMFRSDTGPIYSLKEFLGIRQWVNDNKGRFRREARRVAREWEVNE